MEGEFLFCFLIYVLFLGDFFMFLSPPGEGGGREREETGRVEWIRGEIVGGCERCDVGEGGRKGSGPCMEGQCGLWIDDLC